MQYHAIQEVNIASDNGLSTPSPNPLAEGMLALLLIGPMQTDFLEIIIKILIICINGNEFEHVEHLQNVGRSVQTSMC